MEVIITFLILLLLAQYTDDKGLELGGLFNGLKRNIKVYSDAINKIKGLDSLDIFKNGKVDVDAFTKAVGTSDTVLIGYTETLKDADGVIDLTTASTEGLSKYLKETGQSFNFAAIKAKLLNTALNAGIFLAVTLAIQGAVKIIDNWIHRVEKANEAMKDSVSEYKSSKSSLESINTELDEQNKKLNELLSKDKLTYAEQGQLEELQAITKELMLQQDIAERNAERASKEAAVKTVDAYEKQYGKYSNTKESVDNLLGNENFPLPQGTDDVAGNIVAYIKATELLTQAQEKFNEAKENHEDTTWLADDVQYYIDMVDDFSSEIDKNLTDLQEKRASLEDEYNKAIEKRKSGLEPLTSSDQDIISTYESIYDAIKMVYEYTNQNTWNNMEISNIFNTEGIEKTKDELIAMAKAGELSPETIEGYENLNNAIQNSEIFLKEGQTVAQAFCDEIYGCVKVATELGESINENPISLGDVEH